jgi:hypothetical protein
MNLQENIHRIKEVMCLNEENENAVQHIQKNIDEKILELKNKIPNNVKSVLNPEKMINDFRNYLVSKIPVIIEKSKTGKGGEQFAYECYTKLMELVQTQINDISGFKKFTIKKLAPNKQEFLSNSKNVDLTPFFETFTNIVDFPFLIGWMDKYKNSEGKMLDYSNQISNWVNKNRQTIANSVINKVSNFLYK